jgi:hypothetical protein
MVRKCMGNICLKVRITQIYLERSNLQGLLGFHYQQVSLHAIYIGDGENVLVTSSHSSRVNFNPLVNTDCSVQTAFLHKSFM